MIINNTIKSVLQTYTDQPRQNVAREKMPNLKDGRAKDEFVLSAQAQSFSQILQKAKSGSQVRQYKVDAIAEKINAGEYKVDARLLAEKMLRSRY